MPHHEVTIADTGEMANAIAVRRRVFVQEQGISEEEEVDGKDDQAIHFLLKVDGRVVGAARVRFIRGFGTNYAKVERVAVLQEFRGTGLGRFLMEEVDAWIEKRPWRPEQIQLNSQAEVAGFYRNLGYEISGGSPFMEAGVLHVAMRKRLTYQ